MARRIAHLRDGYRAIEGSTRIVLVTAELAPQLTRMSPSRREDAERALIILAELGDLSLGGGPFRIVEAVGWLFFCSPDRPGDERLAICGMAPTAALLGQFDDEDDLDPAGSRMLRPAKAPRWRQPDRQARRVNGCTDEQ